MDRLLLTQFAVECRIDVLGPPGEQVIHLAGRLSATQVADLTLVCAAVPPPVRLDLSDLVSIDEFGVEALWRLVEQGAAIRNGPEYLRLTLEARRRRLSEGRQS